MADISPNVVILTRDELKNREDFAFQRGVARGKFDRLRAAPRSDSARSAAELLLGYLTRRRRGSSRADGAPIAIKIGDLRLAILALQETAEALTPDSPPA